MLSKKRSRILLLLILTISVNLLLSAGYTQQHAQNEQLRFPDEPKATLININNLVMWAHADGLLGQSPHENGIDYIYPAGTVGSFLADGLLWGGQVRDSITTTYDNQDLATRVGGVLYYSGLQPGKIVEQGIAEDPNAPDVRLWRIRRDWQTADLTRDAVEFFNVAEDSVSQEQIATIRQQYETDWNEWPWEKGAPFYDNNKNGLRDEREEPGFAFADQVVWMVCNDLDQETAINLHGSEPIGLELQITLWAYDREGTHLDEALQNVVFKRYRLIYKGIATTPVNASIDSMFITQFSDLDIGTLIDFAGCDSSRSLGYLYEAPSDSVYPVNNLIPPAFGYVLLQGPDKMHTERTNGIKPKFSQTSKNFPLTSFLVFGDASIEPPAPIWGPHYRGTIQTYQVMNGYLPSPTTGNLERPWDWINNRPTSFMFSGDPISGEGLVDTWPGDRILFLNSGPFEMALGDTQDVIVGLIGGSGEDRLGSLGVMLDNASWAQSLADMNFEIGFPTNIGSTSEVLPISIELYQNYPNPFNPTTTIRYDLPVKSEVTLSVFNILGQEVIRLVDEPQPAGKYTVQWDGKNKKGLGVSSGVYFFNLEAVNFVRVRKMLLVR